MQNVNPMLENMNLIFSKLMESIDGTLVNVIDNIIFLKPDNIIDKGLLKILGTESSKGIISISITIALGILIFYALRYLISKLTLEKVEEPIPFVLKMIIIIAIIMSTTAIITEIMNWNSYITEEILNFQNNGLFFHNKRITFKKFLVNINSQLKGNGNKFDLFTFDGVIKVYVSMTMLNLIFEYAIRYIMVKLFIVLAPLAMVTKISKKTEYIFTNWAKSFFVLLFMQNITAIILLIANNINLTGKDAVIKLINVGMIYVLVKVSFFMKELIGGIAIESNLPFRNFARY